jgi:predicted benzoate:H+ symporter BenE
MALRRSKPLLIAPLIPLWGVLAFVGLQQFAGTRYAVPFLVVAGVTFVALFSYVATHVVKARRSRNLARKGVRL